MKRLTAAILALVITLSLCACGATGNTGAASAGNKPKKIEKPVADTLDGILEAIEDDYKTTVQAFRRLKRRPHSFSRGRRKIANSISS